MLQEAPPVTEIAVFKGSSWTDSVVDLTAWKGTIQLSSVDVGKVLTLDYYSVSRPHHQTG